MQNRRSPVVTMLPTTTQDAEYQGNKSQLSKLSTWANSLGGLEAPKLLKIIGACFAVLVVVIVLAPPSGGLTSMQVMLVHVLTRY